MILCFAGYKLFDYKHRRYETKTKWGMFIIRNRTRCYYNQRWFVLKQFINSKHQMEKNVNFICYVIILVKVIHNMVHENRLCCKFTTFCSFCHRFAENQFLAPEISEFISIYTSVEIVKNHILIKCFVLESKNVFWNAVTST